MRIPFQAKHINDTMFIKNLEKGEVNDINKTSHYYMQKSTII